MIENRKDPSSEDVLQMEAMNTSFYLKVIDCKEKGWKKVISGWIRYVETEWSRFQKENELNRLNELNFGEAMTLSPPLFDIIEKAEDFRNRTNSLFSPYLFPQMQYHGYEQSFPFIAESPQDRVMPTLYNLETAPFEFDRKSGLVTRIADGKIDLGGIGKGYAVQAAVQWLKEIGQTRAGIVDGGGDITVWSDGHKEWKIGIGHPFIKKEEIAQFTLKNGSIATSNIIYRSWKQGSERKHHILNGKTGLPVESSIIQATAITDNCLHAEVAAKLCFMIDEEGLRNQLKKLSPRWTILLVNKEGKISSYKISE